MKLVNEDEYGAYLGVTADFLEEFIRTENNPNFEVFDSRDGGRRFIVTKCSRLPDDEDPNDGRYGINFHRAKPDFPTARAYLNELATARISRQAINGLAFAAETREQYASKSAAWERFYSYVWDKKPQNIWATPHSGSAEREPDDIFPYPKLEMDACVAGVAAQCAFKDTSPALKRTMISVHSHNWYSAVVDLGGFGINDEKKLADAAAKLEEKYAARVQPAAEACRKDFMNKVMPWLEHVLRTFGTLELEKLWPDHGSAVYYSMTGLKLYKRQITRFTLDEFRDAINSLKGKRIKAASFNHLFSGEWVGKQLGLAEHIREGRMGGAVQIECMKYYLKNEPELMADIILDLKRELFK
jgi:hypothetical protein